MIISDIGNSALKTIPFIDKVDVTISLWDGYMSTILFLFSYAIAVSIVLLLDIKRLSFLLYNIIMFTSKVT